MTWRRTSGDHGRFISLIESTRRGGEAIKAEIDALLAEDDVATTEVILKFDEVK